MTGDSSCSGGGGDGGSEGEFHCGVSFITGKGMVKAGTMYGAILAVVG